MNVSTRLVSAMRASLIHLTASVVIAAVTAVFIFLVWYPHPYGELSGGKHLFTLIMLVDIVCGPLLTGVIFNPSKKRAELLRDVGLIVLIQVSAFAYGIHSVWLARPLFLVMEVDRFKVVAAPDLQGENAQSAFDALPRALAPRFYSGPMVVSIRQPKDAEERKKVMFESIQGGRDYAQRPEFYIPYDAEAAEKAVLRGKPINSYLARYSDKKDIVDQIAFREDITKEQLKFLPVVGRKDWIVVLDSQGRLLKFLPGDGF